MEMTPDYSYHGPVAVFDLDDTLISERDFCRRGFLILEQALTDAGIPAEGLAAEMTALLEKREPYMPAFEKIIAEEEVDKALNNRLLDLYGNSTRPLEPRADVRQTLDRLAALGTVMALVTDGRPATQRAKLRSAGLERYFAPHLIYISGERGIDKSSTESFADIVRHYPEARKFLYVGDNPAKDILSPALLGWETAILEYDDDNVHIPAPNDAIPIAPTYSSIRFKDILQIL